MDKVRILIVDDSRISCLMLSDLLTKTNFDVCGTARNTAEAVELYERLHPAAVTMDMNLPDADGIECTRRIKAIDPEARIIMISAMRDASLITRGKSAGISTFLQKPVKSEELLSALTELCAGKAGAVTVWRESYVKTAVNVLRQGIFNLLGLDVDVSISEDNLGHLAINGIAVIIGLTGSPTGRCVLHMTIPVMRSFAAAFLNKNAAEITDKDASDTLEEAANIMMGQWVSTINDMFREKELRITPPGTIFGDQVYVAGSRLTAFQIKISMPFGEAYLDIGFAEGD